MSVPDDLAVALARLGVLPPQSGVNIRPVLLRVVVDLFLQRATHASADLRTFEAMVGPLIEQADPETRRSVAERLIHHPDTPQGVLDRLIDEPMLAAAEMFRHAPLDEAELLAAAERGPVTVAVMIAHRADLSATLATILAARPEPLIAAALAGNRTVTLDRAVLLGLIQRARTDQGLAERLAARDHDPVDLAPLFPMLGPTARRHIIDAVRRLDLGRRVWSRPDGATLATLDRLDRLVLGGEWDGFDHILSSTLGCDEDALRPLLHDGTGDILALALAAVGATSDMAARAFILGDPVIGRSVSTVRRLTVMVEQIAPLAAQRLIGSMMTGAERPQRRLPPAPKALPAARRPEPAVADAAVRRPAVEAPLRRRV